MKLDDLNFDVIMALPAGASTDRLVCEALPAEARAGSPVPRFTTDANAAIAAAEAAELFADVGHRIYKLDRDNWAWSRREEAREIYSSRAWGLTLPLTLCRAILLAAIDNG